jgi:hypothetical protein
MAGAATAIRKDATPSDLHVDQYLTNLSVAFTQDSNKFVADKVFPVVPVSKQSDKYSIYPKGHFWRDEVAPRPLGGRPNQANFDVEQGTYLAEEEGLEYKLDDRLRANADQPLDPEKAGMRLLTEQMMVHRDSDWASAYFREGVWGTDLKGKSSSPGEGEFLQLDQAGTEPVEFFDEERDILGASTGIDPNVLVLGRKAFRKLKNHPEVKDRIKYTQQGIVTAELLAKLLEVDRVVVPGSVKNEAAEGAEDEIDFIVGPKDALFVYSAPNPAIDQPSGGYIFAWTGLIPGATNAYGGVIERGREELAHSDVFQIRCAYDMKVVAPELGTFYHGLVS